MSKKMIRDMESSLADKMRKGVKRAEDDKVNPATGRPYWDEKAKILPANVRVKNMQRGGRALTKRAEDDATNPRTGRPYWDESAASKTRTVGKTRGR